MQNRSVELDHLPVGEPKVTDFKIVTDELMPITDGQLLLKTRYISVDPYLRAKMSGGHQPPLNAGDTMYSRAVAEVVDSRHPEYQNGELVIGFLEWRDHVVSDGGGLTKIDRDAPSLSAYLGVLGFTGFWFANISQSEISSQTGRT